MFYMDKKELLLINFIILLFISNILSEGKVKVEIKTEEKRVNMGTSFCCRYANYSMNSLVKEKLNIKGKLKSRSVFSNRYDEGDITDFFKIDDQYGLISTDDCLQLFRFKDGFVTAEQWKDRNSHVVCKEDGSIFYIYDALRVSTPSKFKEPRYNQPYIFIPEYSNEWGKLRCIFPFEEYFVAVSIAGPFPKDERRHILWLVSGKYKEHSINNEVWSYSFNKPVPPLPVFTYDNNIIVYHQGFLKLISSKEGKLLKEKAIDKEIIVCSVGPNDHLYSISKIDNTHYLTEWDEDFNELTSVEIIPLNYNQPPITLPGGAVVLMADKLGVAYSKGEKIWEYLRASTEDNAPFLATATSDNKILLVDGIKIVCFDEKWKKVWEYKKDDIKPFLTQPVVGNDGFLYVVDNQALYVIE